jgi:hypothetical protein
MMAQPGSFGRRAAPQSSLRAPAPAPARSAPAPQADSIFARANAEANAAARAAMLPPLPVDSPVDEELAEWKATRKRAFKLPWRSLSLIASLCFGVASFVLPDNVNDAVNWVLYPLAAISFYVGVTGKKAKAKTVKA